MSRFAALKESVTQKPKDPETQELKTTEPKEPKERPDRVFVGGYYSKMFRSTLNRLALDEDTTTHALIGEAVDLLMRSRGKHPLAER